MSERKSNTSSYPGIAIHTLVTSGIKHLHIRMSLSTYTAFFGPVKVKYFGVEESNYKDTDNKVLKIVPKNDSYIPSTNSRTVFRAEYTSYEMILIISWRPWCAVYAHKPIPVYSEKSEDTYGVCIYPNSKYPHEMPDISYGAGEKYSSIGMNIAHILKWGEFAEKPAFLKKPGEVNDNLVKKKMIIPDVLSKTAIQNTSEGIDDKVKVPKNTTDLFDSAFLNARVNYNRGCISTSLGSTRVISDDDVLDFINFLFKQESVKRKVTTDKFKSWFSVDSKSMAPWFKKIDSLLNTVGLELVISDNCLVSKIRAYGPLRYTNVNRKIYGRAY